MWDFLKENFMLVSLLVGLSGVLVAVLAYFFLLR